MAGSGGFGTSVGVRRMAWRGLALVAVAILAWIGWTTLQARAGGASGSLTTTFNSNNGNEGNTFDLRVRPRGGIDVKRFDVNVSDQGESGPIRVWTRRGTSVGFETSEDGWRRRGTVQVTSRGEGNRTPARISFHLPRGNWGVAIGVPGTDPDLGMDYTSGEDTFENDDLVLRTRTGLGDPVLNGGGAVTGARMWNGTIHYRVPCEAAKNKVRRARRQVRKADQRLDDAVASGNAGAIAQAEQNLESKLNKLQRAKRAKRRACS